MGRPVARELGDRSTAPVALAYLVTNDPLFFPIVAFDSIEACALCALRTD